MESNQRNLRRAAAQAFMESLDKLQETLAAEEGSVTPPEITPPTNYPDSPGQRSVAFDLTSLEQAVEDIEQFIQAKEELES